MCVCVYIEHNIYTYERACVYTLDILNAPVQVHLSMCICDGKQTRMGCLCQRFLRPDQVSIDEYLNSDYIYMYAYIYIYNSKFLQPDEVSIDKHLDSSISSNADPRQVKVLIRWEHHLQSELICVADVLGLFWGGA